MKLTLKSGGEVALNCALVAITVNYLFDCQRQSILFPEGEEPRVGGVTLSFDAGYDNWDT